MNKYFTVDKTEGIILTHRSDNWQATVMFHDGTGQLASDFSKDTTEWGVAGRAEVTLVGKQKQFKDFASWSGEAFGLMIAAGVDYEDGEAGGDDDFADLIKYTVDLSVEGGGCNAFVAFIGQHVDGDSSPDIMEADQLGLVAQIGVFVVPDKVDVFGRYEYIDFDGAFVAEGQTDSTTDDIVSLVTVGFNYYVSKHQAKFTCDVVHVFDPLVEGSSGLGLVTSTGNQTVVRSQFQLAF